MKKPMKSNDGLPMHRLAGACALAMVLMLPQAGFAQQVPAAGAAASEFEAAPLSSLIPGAAAARPTAKPNTEYAYDLTPGGIGVTGRNADSSPGACQASAVNGTTEFLGIAALTSTIVTQAGAASPLTVTPGQIVQAIVTISFS